MRQKFLRVHEVAAQLNVSPSTVRYYETTGKLECLRSPSGQRVFTQEQVNAFRGIDTNAGVTVYYARSSRGSDSELNSQIETLTQAFGEPARVYSDKGSGLNENRRGLNQLLDHAAKGGIAKVCVTQKDRLTRFGFHYLVRLLALSNVEVVVLGEKEQSLQEELFQDFMSLIASFSGKFYRLRGYEQQQQLLSKLQDTLDEKQK